MPLGSSTIVVAIVGIASGVGNAVVSGQGVDVRSPLTLEQALDVAEAKSEGVAIARVALTRNDGDFMRAKSGRRPQLSASATYDRSLANEFQGVFDNIDFGGGSGGSGSTEGLADLPFGRANTWRATLSFSQTLYSWGRLDIQDRLVATGRESAQQSLKGARAQVRLDVTQAFYDAALAGRLVAIAEATYEQAGATLRQVQAGFDAGTQPEFEVLRARVTRDSQLPQVIRQRVNRDVALLRLKQLLDLPPDADVLLAAGLDDERLDPPPAFAQAVTLVEATLPAPTAATFTLQSNPPLPDRNAVAEAATSVRLREVTYQSVVAERKPTVAFNSAYSRIAYPSAFVPTFDRSNWSLGAALSVPLLTGGRQRGDELVARADVEQARIQLQQTQELAALDTRSAWAELVAARAAWQATSGTVQQAVRAYEIAEVRYRAGLSTQLELSDARLLRQQAEANRAQAARDLQVARAKVALLPDLPLGGAAGSAGAAGSGGRGATQSTQPAASAQQSGGQRQAGVTPGGAQTGAR
jgi:outer membrane protein TolC